MLYFIPFLVIMIVIMTAISHKSKSILLLAFILFSFTVDILFLLLYLAKDNYYYNVIFNYFRINTFFWNKLVMLPIDRVSIIRVINVSSVVFILGNYYFSLSFGNPISAGKVRKHRFVQFLILAQVLIYDPALYEFIYLLIYPALVTTAAVSSFYKIADCLFLIMDFSFLFASAGILIRYSYKQIKKIAMTKNYMLLIIASHLSILIAYCFLFSWYPMQLIKVSKIANYTSYRSIPLGSNSIIYNVFPYFLTLSAASITFAIFRYASYRQRLSSEDTRISKEIDAAAIASSVFSHYIKNEYIATISQIEEMETTDLKNGQTGQMLEEMKERCQKVLSHLDDMHSISEDNKMYLTQMSVEIPIRNALGELNASLKDCRVELHIPPVCPEALLDENYFTHVIVNILTNGIEAVANEPDERKFIEISVEEQPQWITVSIRDHGPGIKPEDVRKIFTPYFSTKSTSKNWGIGLSLCHKIVTGHGGKILVDSRIGLGSNFKILLPPVHRNLRKVWCRALHMG